MARQVSRSDQNLDPFDPEKLRLTDDMMHKMKCQNRCKDMVNSPPHYTQHPSGVECIQVTEHMSFNVGNAVKYLWRCDLKGNALEDLKKARFYVEREIKRREDSERIANLVGRRDEVAVELQTDEGQQDSEG